MWNNSFIETSTLLHKYDTSCMHSTLSANISYDNTHRLVTINRVLSSRHFCDNHKVKKLGLCKHETHSNPSIFSTYFVKIINLQHRFNSVLCFLHITKLLHPLHACNKVCIRTLFIQTHTLLVERSSMYKPQYLKYLDLGCGVVGVVHIIGLGTIVS